MVKTARVLRKIYNKGTGGYKIDIFADGNYVSSTDFSKRCCDAIIRYKQTHEKFVKDKKITARFARL